ncbi:MAG: homocysteine biosynthesis protein [Ignavibacteriales bacterium]
MSIKRTYEEINEKIKSGKVVVVTAEEIIDIVEEKGIEEAARTVDVVTTGTFGPMCSSSAYFNFGHTTPRMKMSKVWMNDVPAYTGIAAVDAILGATEMRENDPLNMSYPGEFRYGGGHVITDLLLGKKIKFEAKAYGTDCYPRKHIETYITLDDVNEAILFNQRNAYQNYNCAVNQSDKIIYTYMGTLKPHLQNASYCSAGQLSPLLNDPDFLTIGMGTKIFLGGGEGYVVWQGTQHCPVKNTHPDGFEMAAAGGTLAVMGDLKGMKAEWLRGTSMIGYGATLTVGIGIPIPILSDEIMKYVSVKDEDLFAPVVDYSGAYPNRINEILGYVSYKELKAGKINIKGKEIPTSALSSYPKAKEIAYTLKEWITSGKFELTKPVRMLPSAKDEIKLKSLKDKEV